MSPCQVGQATSPPNPGLFLLETDFAVWTLWLIHVSERVGQLQVSIKKVYLSILFMFSFMSVTGWLFVCPHPNASVEALTPSAMVFEGEGLGEAVWVRGCHEGWSLGQDGKELALSPCQEDMARRQPLDSQEESCHQSLTMLPP